VSELEQLAADAVKRALAGGATDAECTISEGEEFNVHVRMREVEQLTQAGSRGAGIRVLAAKRSGSSYTSDLSRQGLKSMVDAALALAAITTEDPFAGMPEECGRIDGDLRLYDDAIARMETEWKIAQARATEEIALAADPRIQNSEGATFQSWLGTRVFANSRGFVGSYRTSSCGLSVSPVAKQNGSMERDYWYSSSRTAGGLETPELIGTRAAERAVRRLNPRKVATQRAPVIFEPRTARALLEDIFSALNGSAVYRHASFLAGKLGEKIASERLTVIDDATIPGLFGTSPFDDEGVVARRTISIDRGVLKSYLLNSYSARKLGLATTGNASRGLSGAAGVGPGNFYIENGDADPAKLIAGVRNGLYVTSLIGEGANTVTGDYSTGAIGMWIENGELAYPVSEITIAGNLKQMLLDLEAVGNDLEFRGAIAAPTLKFPEMTISGH
jgi:PmbA protein